MLAAIVSVNPTAIILVTAIKTLGRKLCKYMANSCISFMGFTASWNQFTKALRVDIFFLLWKNPLLT